MGDGGCVVHGWFTNITLIGDCVVVGGQWETEVVLYRVDIQLPLETRLRISESTVGDGRCAAQGRLKITIC